VFDTLAKVHEAISAQIATKNLAAVLIQLNDTYLIDERADVPGLARVARLVQDIRSRVADALGSDRTLVLHAGDYLSPSLMSNEFMGRQMIDMLQHCRVDFAAIGNHEFDLGIDVLAQRLSETSFVTIAANLAPQDAAAAPRIKSVVYWPPRHPFFAITAVAGEQTRTVALKKGWKASDPKKELGPILKSVAANPIIRGLVVLTHMDRGEDLDLRKFVAERWPSRGVVHLIAGHDHDIHWTEPDGGRIFLSKCLSNAKSLNVMLVLRDVLGSLGSEPPALEPEMTHEEAEWRDRNHPYENSRPSPIPTVAPRVEGRCRNANDIVRAYRAAMPKGVAQQFTRSFAARLRKLHKSSYAGHSEELIEEGALGYWVTNTADAQSVNDSRKMNFALKANELIAQVKPLPAAEAQVAHWQRELRKRREVPLDEIVVELKHAKGVAAMLDASDDGLRNRSTDFGNFVVDAVKQHTAADVALINSGCFRFDGAIPATIRLSHLHEVFLYDRSDALIEVTLHRDEVLRFYHYAAGRGGHGAFLQV
jgi:2',3'-cyclic-nucleotide 2'-phosphodiesterase (5'-nucleotidase family)